jgi:hypothetical protein
MIVDAVFALGIMKTGLATSDSIYTLDETDTVDAGTVYTEVVDFDNFVVDPSSKEHLFATRSSWATSSPFPPLPPRNSGLYKNDLIERLPRCGQGKDKRASRLSMRTSTTATTTTWKMKSRSRSFGFPRPTRSSRCPSMKALASMTSSASMTTTA